MSFTSIFETKRVGKGCEQYRKEALKDRVKRKERSWVDELLSMLLA